MIVTKTRTTPPGTMSLWVMTPFGFIAPSLRPRIPPGDPRDIQVRSRRPETLDALRDRWLPELGETVKLPKTDYEVRAYCTRRQLAAALARMALATDDVSFKDLSEGPEGLADPELARDTHLMYMDVWTAVGKHGSATVCEKWGHYDPRRTGSCRDCGAKMPAPKTSKRKTNRKVSP